MRFGDYGRLIGRSLALRTREWSRQSRGSGAMILDYSQEIRRAKRSIDCSVSEIESFIL